MSDPRVTVCGSANMDVIVEASRFPRPGETVTGGTLRVLPGGKGVNQAVAAARAGARCRLIACVGRDDFGERVLAFLRGERIDTSLVARGTSPTGVATITVAGGENAIVVAPGANRDLEERSLPADHAPSDVLVAQLEVPQSVARAFLESGSASGSRTILNAAPPQEVDRALLEAADVLVVNETEAEAVLGLEAADERGVADAARRCRGTLIVTLGARGALVAGGADVKAVAAPAVHAVDSTGAGDCFVGYLAAGLAGGRELTSSVEWAVRAAAICVTRPGAGPSMPHAAELAGA